MNLSVCSFNVQGLGLKHLKFKRKKHIKSIFLQETHSKLETESIWRQDSKYHVYYSGRSSNSEGLCILLKVFRL